MKKSLITRMGLAAEGWPRSLIDAATEQGLHRVTHGTYSHSGDDRAVIDCLLQRAGHGAVLSHRLAAHLHGLDLFEEPQTVDLTVPYGATFHPVQSAGKWPEFCVHRSRTLSVDDCELYEGKWPITTKARTVLDLARGLSADRLEVVVESALRSLDRFDPSVWDTACLARLTELPDMHPRAAGSLRLVLRRRPPGCRPTGSPRETLLVQAARSKGHGDLQRQVRLTVNDLRSRSVLTVYPDLGEFDRLGIAFEYDGEQYHRDRRAAERKRDNLIGRVVQVVRFDATTSMQHNAAVIDDTIRAASGRRWPDPSWLVSRSDHDVSITIPK